MAAAENSPPSSPRLGSLDALRGFTMFWIIGADALGDAFRHLQGGAVSTWLGRELGHTEWAGLTFYDLIFPLFIFLVGAAVPLSLDRLVERESRPAAWRRLLRRGALMYGLGLLYYGGLGGGWDHIRWVGVLQRLALCYVAAGALHLSLRPRAIAAVAVGLLVGYWALMTFVPVPGCGAGDFARGHNLANWLDAHYLPGRVWYGDYDPEGLLSTLPAIASGLIGLLAGRWLVAPDGSPATKTRPLVLAGIALLAVGYLWGLPFPVIKRLWTSSYALVTGGWGVLLLATFHYLIDVRGVRRWATPFVWIGSNALLIYFVSHLIDFDLVSGWLVGGPIAAALDALWPGLGGLVVAVTGITLCTALCGWLYARKIFVRI